MTCSRSHGVRDGRLWLASDRPCDATNCYCLEGFAALEMKLSCGNGRFFLFDLAVDIRATGIYPSRDFESGGGATANKPPAVSAINFPLRWLAGRPVATASDAKFVHLE